MERRKVRVLLVSSRSIVSCYGGGEIYLKNLIEELVRKNIRPLLAVPAENEIAEGDYLGCRIFPFRPSIGRSDAVEFLRAIKPDVVHAHGYKARFADACACVNIPCIVTAHHGGILCPAGALLNYRDRICTVPAGLRVCLPCVLRNIHGGIVCWPFLSVIPAGLRVLIGALFRKMPFVKYITPVGQATLEIKEKVDEWSTITENARWLIAPSDAIAGSMELNGAPQHKIKVLPHGIPAPTIDRIVPKRLSCNRGIVQFFFVGRINRVKGVHILLEAFGRIDAPAELHIIGDAGNKAESRYMLKLQRKYSSDKRIVWHGKVPHDKMNEKIRDFDVMVHPSICLDVFGLNISEALAMGKPVLGSRCGGAEMQIVDGRNGFLVNPHDVESLTNRLWRMIREPSLIDKMSEQALLPFPIDRHVEELVSMYNDVSKIGDDR